MLFEADICGSLDQALAREWLETNGLGGFASSTLCGLNTRRYHGLLVAALRPPVDRKVLLSKLEETLIVGDQRIDLSANRYPGVVHPEGYRHLNQFRLEPFPVFIYEAAGVEITKTVFLTHDENTVVVEYHASANCTLEIRPLIAFRDYHATTHRNDAMNPRLDISAHSVSLNPYADLPPLHFAHNADQVTPTGVWYLNFEYDRERERGLDFEEDLFQPFLLTFTNAATLIVSTVPHSIDEAPELRRRELDRRAALPSRAADQFLVRREDKFSVIAGYHWFADWGRDTMISLPGLALSTGRADTGREILLEFIGHLSQGMLPNRFPDQGETPEYNTVDATLWMFEAVRQLCDLAFVRDHLYAALCEVIDWHIRGTRYGIRLDTDGLLQAGVPGVQLTWMDARVGDWVVTPRIGKPVEIQALWHNALRILSDFAAALGDAARSDQCARLAAQCRASFEAQFWNGESLYDVVGDGPPDASLRPNQIFAVSLSESLLPPEKEAQVVAVVERELLTPYGLRTLSPRDPRYRGRYEGDQTSRDGAYHQGTVWPWLLGPFLQAWIKVHGAAPPREWLDPLREHLRTAGLGQISEIFDGDPPHQPRGCIAQAWSLAALAPYLPENI